MEVALETLQLCISMKPPPLGRGGGQGRKKPRTKREEERQTKRQRQEGNRHSGSTRGDPGNQQSESGKGQLCSSSIWDHKEGMWEVGTISEKKNRTMKYSRREKKEPGGLGLGRS